MRHLNCLTQAQDISTATFPDNNHLYLSPFSIDGQIVHALLDTGAQKSWINKRLVASDALVEKLKDPIRPTGFSSKVTGKDITREIAHLQVQLLGNPNATSLDPFFVLPSLRFDAILGTDWLQRHGTIMDFKTNCITSDTFGDIPIIGQVSRRNLDSSKAINCVLATLTIPELGLAEWEKGHEFEDVDEDHEVTLEELQQVPTEFHSFKAVFSKKRADRLPPHRPSIDIQITIEEGGEQKMPAPKAYKLGPKEQLAMQAYISENKKKGFIVASKSPIACPAFFVPKVDSKELRMVVDYKALNAVTIKDKYAIPLISEILDAVSVGRIFTKIDLRGAYNLLRVAKGHEYKTAFITSQGCYEYRVMPFGLSNAPSCFQRWINSIFQDIMYSYVMVYLDDIIIFSQDRTQHTKHILEVLRRLQENSLFASPKKCEWYSEKLRYLGHVITPDSLQMCNDKVDAILNWEPPKSIKGIQRFLGFANYYRDHIKGFSALTKPLNHVLKKDTQKELGVTTANQILVLPKDALQAFESLKQAFASSAVLAHYDPSLTTVLETDASNFAIGAIFSQRHGDQWKLVSCYSRSFSPAEMNYDVHDKEMLCIVESCRHWRHYFLGLDSFIIKTDHKNLEAFMKTKELFGRQIRWAQFLAQFNFKIQFQQGLQNGRCDALSRKEELSSQAFAAFGNVQENRAEAKGQKGRSRPQPKVFGTLIPPSTQVIDVILKGEDGPTAVEDDTLIDFSAINNINNYSRYSLEEDDLTLSIKEAQRKLSAQEIDELTRTSKISKKSVNGNQILTCKGVLFVPNVEELRTRALQQHHDRQEVGHPGIKKTIAILNRHYAWPGDSEDVKDYIASCGICLRSKPSRQLKYGPLRPLEAPNEPWKSVSMDRIVGLPPSNGYTAIIVIVDRFSKMAKFFPTLETFNSADLADLFIREIVFNFGTPNDLVTDRGPEFASNLWGRICEKLEINRKLSTAYHPETDGQTERVNQVLEIFLRQYCNYHQDDWSSLLPAANYCYNSTPHSATQFSPFQVVYNYQPTVGSTHITELAEVQSKLTSAELRKEVKQNLIDAREAAEKQFNRKRLDLPNWKEGDLVMLSAKNWTTRRPSKKLDNKQLGPFKIIKKVSTHAYQLQLDEGMRIHDVFHVCHLGKVPQDRFPSRHQPPPPPVEINGETEYLVEAIIGERRRAGKLEFKVRWKGFTSEEDTWEPLRNIQDLEAYDHYLQAKELRAKRKNTRSAGPTK